VHSMVKGAIDDSAHLHVAGMVLQAVTGVRPTVHRAKHGVAQFGIRERMPISLTCQFRGNQAYDFVDKCINLVFPKIKDWEGVVGEWCCISRRGIANLSQEQLVTAVGILHGATTERELCCSPKSRSIMMYVYQCALYLWSSTTNSVADVSTKDDSGFPCCGSYLRSVGQACATSSQRNGCSVYWEVGRLDGCK
jgi:hypothetical protein